MWEEETPGRDVLFGPILQGAVLTFPGFNVPFLPLLAAPKQYALHCPNFLWRGQSSPKSKPGLDHRNGFLNPHPSPVPRALRGGPEPFEGHNKTGPTNYIPLQILSRCSVIIKMAWIELLSPVH